MLHISRPESSISSPLSSTRDGIITIITKMKAIIITICAFTLLPLLFCERLAEDIAPVNIPTVEAVEPVKHLKEQINPIRVPPVKRDINQLAKDKLRDLVATDYWNHTNSNGCDFICRTKSYLNDYSWIGENLYRGVCNKENAFRLWRESQSHLAVLNHEYNQEVLLMQEYEQNHCYIVLIRGVKK